MRVRSLTQLAAFLVGGMTVLACNGPASESASVQEPALTEDAGARDPGDDAVAGDGPEVASYVESDVGATAKMRWSIDGADVTEGYEAKLELAQGDAHPYQLTAHTPIQGGLPVVHLRLGRGTEPIAPGDYDCAKLEAVIVVVESSESRLMTALKDGSSRPCTVHVEQAGPPPKMMGVPDPDRRFKRVRGTFEGTVGLRDDPGSPTREIRGAFATSMIDTNVR